MYMRLIKWWLTAILFILPFIILIKKLTDDIYILKYFFLFLDEITIFILLPVAIRELYKNNEIFDRLYLGIILPIIGFCLLGVTSGIVNGNNLIVTILGTIDYIKYFLVIFIYAAFFREFNDFRKIFRLLLILAVFLSVLATIEEIWALVFRYVLGRSILDPMVYLFSPPPPSIELSPGIWRFGFLRAFSDVLKYNSLGFFCIFILTIYTYTNKKTNPMIFTILLTGALVSISRMVYASLLIMGVLRKLHNKWLIVSFVSLALIVLSFWSLSVKLGEPNTDSLNYRDRTQKAAMEVYSENPIWGRGPGMFGGIISIYFESPVYKEINFPIMLINKLGGLDQFWPNVFAEMGTVGVAFFAILLAAVVKTLLRLRNEKSSGEIKNLIAALLVFGVAIFIFSLGGVFNAALVAFPYYAFIGICFGSVFTSQKRKINS